MVNHIIQHLPFVIFTSAKLNFISLKLKLFKQFIPNPIVLVLAVGIDLLFGEPPSMIHPVVLFGKIIDKILFINRGKKYLRFIFGFFNLILVILFALFLSILPSLLYIIYTICRISNEIAYIFYLVVSAFLLKSCFSIKSMIEHAEKTVKTNMESSKVQMLVSRDVKKLNYNQKCSAVIESIAENYVDGLLSPLFFYSFFGLAGALVYKAVNTCDSMIGYKNEKYEWYGKACAKMDDILNFIPARISILLFSMLDIKSVKAFKKKIENRINACPMIAAAYILNVKLEKPHRYIINELGRNPTLDDVVKMISIFRKLSLITVLITLFVVLLVTY